ncbi:MAG: hypothetical protein IEMM0008_1406 [bacterium]|nr:MAG: hypothetical protein IEMM0008_1406 [bacterium]
MSYDFLIETYDTERLKIVSVWSMFKDEDMTVRPNQRDKRGRSVREQMIHQCVSENLWFINMLDIDMAAPPLPEKEERLEFIKRYASDSAKRLAILKDKNNSWWEETSTFFDVSRSRAWIMTRRLNHSSHHRGQQIAILRMLGRDLHSNYGPTADTGGLMQNKAPSIYAYSDIESLLEGEPSGRNKSKLPGPGNQPCTERPD